MANQCLFYLIVRATNKMMMCVHARAYRATYAVCLSSSFPLTHHRHTFSFVPSRSPYSCQIFSQQILYIESICGLLIGLLYYMRIYALWRVQLNQFINELTIKYDELQFIALVSIIFANRLKNFKVFQSFIKYFIV